MKTLIVFGLALMITFSSDDLIAQGRRAEAQATQALRVAVAEDVTRAANQANLKPNEGLVAAFADAATSQKPETDHVYTTVPKDVRVARLTLYLRAKAAAKTGVPLRGVTGDEVSDFHWSYIARDVMYIAMRLESPGPVKLLRVESAGTSDDFVKGEEITPGAVLLLPNAPHAADAVVTATFELGNTKAAWTGHPTTGGPLTVVAARTSRGCEISVNSKPTGATVYFNGKEYRAQTNTSSVREPGTWEVTLRRDGYREWRQQRSLDAGESWAINVPLVKQSASELWLHR